MKILRVVFAGLTSTVRIPLVVSGKAICSPTPSYPTILGLIGCCAGREIYPNETRVGFEYSFGANENNMDMGIDLEVTHRMKLTDNGKLKANPKGTAIKEYEFHVNPRLILYLDNISFIEYFKTPRGIPSLGRSQDIVWIEGNPEILEVEPIEGGITRGSTLMPFPQEDVGGNLLRLPEYFDNTNSGRTRIPKNIRLFQAVPPNSAVHGKNLFLIKGSDDKHVFYLHEWESIDGKK